MTGANLLPPTIHAYTYLQAAAAVARPTAMDEQEDEFGDGGGGSDARARRRQTLVLGATGGGSLMTGAGVGVAVEAELAGAFTEAQLNSASDRFREAWARVQVGFGWEMGICGRLQEVLAHDGTHTVFTCAY